jgi:hypothetical protein
MEHLVQAAPRILQTFLTASPIQSVCYSLCLFLVLLFLWP